MIVGKKAVRTAAALRDFFAARNRTEMDRACQSLAETAQTPLPQPVDWQEIEFCFNRLFVGPQTLQAPPFASVYIDHEPYVMGHTTLSVRRLYQMLGLASSLEGSLPDDHIVIELDACLHMHAGLLQSGSTQVQAAYGFFLSEHMALWIPAFAKRVKAAPGSCAVIIWVVSELEQWLGKEYDWVCQSKANEAETTKLREEK